MESMMGHMISPIMRLIVGHILEPVRSRYSLDGAYTAPIMEHSMGLTYLVRIIWAQPSRIIWALPIWSSTRPIITI